MNLSDCGWVQDHLSAYLDQALSERELRGIAAHLAACKACRQSFDDLRVTQTLLQRAEVPPSAPDFWPRIYAQIGRREPAIPSLRAPWILGGGRLARFWSGRRRLATAAMMIVGLLALLVFGAKRRATPNDDVDDFVAEHARHHATHPLGDRSHMTFVSAELSAPASPDDD